MKFSVMFGIGWFLVAVGLTAFLWHSARSEAARRRQGQAFARRNLAWIDGRYVPLFDRRLGQRSVRAAVGVPVLALFALGLVLGPQEHAYVYLGLAATVLAVMLPMGLALDVRAERRWAHGAGTRSGPGRVSDYVSTWQRLAAWLAFAGAVALAALSAHLLRSYGPHPGHRPVWPIWAAAVAGAGQLAATEVLARRLVSVPRVADDAAHLYWQDALRGLTLDAAYMSPLINLLVISVMASGLMDEAARYGWAASSPWGELGPSSWFLAYALLTSLRALPVRSRPYFRGRLWPALAPGQVLRTGDEYPLGLPLGRVDA